jgi:hypothetical protein
VTVTDDELRAELLRRVEKDQVARKAHDWDAMREADAENLPWLKRLVAERGWPGRFLVGDDGAHAMWLLTQHADADPAFQRHCLELLTAAVDAGEASRTERAYLTDRVLLHEGGQQEYGTQLTSRGGKWVPRNLRDPDGVDERRAAVGMRPLAEYLARFADLPNVSRLKCSQCDAWTPYEPPDIGESVTVTCTGCGREMTISEPSEQRPPGGAMPVKCPGCGAWASFVPPAPGGQFTFTCPQCGHATTATFKG